MGILEAFILGLIQGITEFLPVSSSGHLEIVKAIFGNNMMPKESATVTVVLHFATALSTIVIFRKDIWDILKGLFQFKWNEETQFALKIIASMVPAAVIGVLFNKELDTLFAGNLVLVGFMLLVTAVLLLLADKANNTDKDVSMKSAIIVGIAQAIAILPGISRSGATISTSVLLGIDRSKAARFSFLMVVPLIFGKVAKDILDGGISFTTENKDIVNSGISFTSENAMPMLVGFLVAFVSGLLACKVMIALVKKSKLIYFSIYCAIVGLIALGYTFLK